MNRKSHNDRARLLNLLRADPHEPIPHSLAEARDITNQEQEQPTHNYPERQRCHESGKTCFSSQHQAKQAARSRLNKGANTSRLRTYLCPDCHQWHMSSSHRPQR